MRELYFLYNVYKGSEELVGIFKDYDNLISYQKYYEESHFSICEIRKVITDLDKAEEE